eukprot:INCI13491.4.p1 GENE.INCI13491.4~~INCI13491.4.p1  ORF type:complete len:548 (-),score=72.42 INCI13491.4:428-2071(-)
MVHVAVTDGEVVKDESEGGNKDEGDQKYYVDEHGKKHRKIKGVKDGFGVTALVVVYVTIFLDVFAWGFLNPVLPYIVEAFVDNRGDVGLLNGLVGASYSLAQMIGAFVLGTLSDRMGRRPILLVCLLMSGLSLGATVFTNSVWSLTLVRSFAGLFAGSLPIGITYIGDVVEPSHRPKFMGFVGFAVSMGLVAGPAVGGALSQKELYFYVCSLYENCCEPGTAACYPNTTDFDLSLVGPSNVSLPGCSCMKYGASSLVAAGLNILNFVLAMIYIKESRPKISAEERAAAARSAAAVKMSPARKYGFGIGYTAVFIANFAFCVWDAQVPLFYKAAWFPDPTASGWESAATWNGVGFAVFGIIMSLMQFFLSARVIKCIGVRNTLFGGSFLRSLAYIACLWMPSGGLGVMIGLVLVAATGSLNFSGFQVMAANMAPPQIMGRMMGLMQTIIALARATAPIAGGLVFDADNRTTLFVDSLGITSTHDGEDDGLAIFVFAGAGMMVTALVLLLMPKLPIKDTDKPVPFCCASKKHVGARELADPLLDSDNQE